MVFHFIPWVDRYAPLGSMGVRLFFVLSGFLITRTLLQWRDTPGRYRIFYGRRALRVVPLYYATLILVFVVLPGLGGPQVPASDLAWSGQWPLWLFVSNWTAPFGFGAGPVPHFWSLAVEEQFYLLWPLVVYRCDRGSLVRACAWVVLVALASRVVLIHLSAPWPMSYMFTVTRMDALAMGSAVAAWLQDPGALSRLLKSRWRLTMAGAVVGLLTVVLGVRKLVPAYAIVLTYSMYALAFSALLVAAIAMDSRHPAEARGVRAAPWHRFLRSRAMRAIGRYSYAMYVLHVPVAALLAQPLMQRLNGGAPATVPVALAYVAVLSSVTFVAAWASYHLFEKHFLHMKQVWFAVPARVAA